MKLFGITFGLSVLIATVGLLLPTRASEAPAAGPKYIGADKCKKCHDAKSKGSFHAKWSETKHAKAFETLASDKAKEIAKAKGIADPQNDEKCIKCHTTGHEAPAAEKDKNFKPENVQCEACHGPGEKHFKARMASEDEGEGPLKIGEGEIVRATPETCKKCHNEESPTYKPFCYQCRYEKIMHLDPRRKRTEEELKTMKCGCDKCKGGECNGQHGDKKK